MAKIRKPPLIPIGQPISVRIDDGDGVGYEDPLLERFAFETLIVAGRDLPALDCLIESQTYWATVQLIEVRDDIIEYRSRSISAYKKGDFDLAMAEIRCAFLTAEIARLHKLVVPKANSKFRSERNLRARRESMPTPEKIRDVRKRLSSDQAVATRLKVSLKTVQRAMKGHRPRKT